MIMPVNQDGGHYRRFGKLYKEGYHVGKDFECDIDTPVYAVDDGETIFSDQVNGFGSMNPSSKGGVIIIRHHDKWGNPYITLYGHIKREKRVAGMMVKAGEQIGTVDKFWNSGYLLPHLHFGKAKGENVPKTKWGYVKTIEDLNKWSDPLSE